MYRKFFSLEKHPFSLTPDPSFLFLTAAHREALAGLLFAITCRKGFLVLTGDAGTGKTTLLRTMLKRVSPANTIFSFLVHPTLTSAEFLEYTLLDFGFTDLPASKAQRLNLFHQFLVRSSAEGKTPVLVVDEAHKLSPELLEEIRLLTNAETAEHKLLQIVLAGQNELSTILARDDMRQLRQRIAVRVNVGALNGNEVLQYMQSRWLRAGASQPFPFETEAVETITRIARGIPRVINAIADAALLSAFANETRRINAGQIREVAGDLQLAPLAVRGHDAPGMLALNARLPLTASDAVEQRLLLEPAAMMLERYVPKQEKKPMLARWATRLGLGSME